MWSLKIERRAIFVYPACLAGKRKAENLFISNWKVFGSLFKLHLRLFYRLFLLSPSKCFKLFVQRYSPWRIQSFRSRMPVACCCCHGFSLSLHFFYIPSLLFIYLLWKKKKDRWKFMAIKYLLQFFWLPQLGTKMKF